MACWCNGDKNALCRDSECLAGAGIVQLWAAVGLWCKFQSFGRRNNNVMSDQRE